MMEVHRVSESESGAPPASATELIQDVQTSVNAATVKVNRRSTKRKPNSRYLSRKMKNKYQFNDFK